MAQGDLARPKKPKAKKPKTVARRGGAADTFKDARDEVAPKKPRVRQTVKQIQQRSEAQRQVDEINRKATKQDIKVRTTKTVATRDVADAVADAVEDVKNAVYGRRATDTERRGIRAGAIKAPRQSAPTVATGLGKIPKNVGLVIVDDPKKQIPKLVTDTAKSVASIPAGIADAVTDPKGAVKDIAADYKRRYGDLLDGTAAGERRFRERLKKDGVAPEVFDIVAGASAGGTVAGRGAQVLAREGKLGKRLERVATEPRKPVRVSGGRTEQADLSPNLIRNVGGKTTDAVRGAVQRRRASKEEAPAVVREAQARGEVTPVVTALANRKAKVRVARRKGEALQQMRSEQHQEIRQGAERTVGKLSGDEQKAFAYAMKLGVTKPDVAVRELEKHKARIVAERAERPGMFVSKRTDELPVIDRLLASKGAAFTERVAEAVRLERRRAERTAAGDPGVDAQQAQLRRYAAQAEHLGVRRGKVSRKVTAEEIKRADEMEEMVKSLRARAEAQRSSGKYAFGKSNEVHLSRLADDLEREARDLRSGKAEVAETNAQFLRRVKRAAAEAGLERPGYYKSEKRPEGVFSTFAVGGRGAVQGPKKYSGELFRTGRESTDPQTYVRGVAQNIKRKYNWNLVADSFDENTFEWSRNKTIDELKDELEKRGVDPRSVAFWNPKRYRDQRQAGDDTASMDVEPGSASIADAVTRSTIDGMSTVPADFRGTSGWSVVPKAVHDEIMADTRPSGAAMRSYDVAKGKVSRVLLANPAWLTFQTASNGLLAGLAGTGPVDFVKAQVWWKNLSADERKAFGSQIGVTPWHDDQTHLGAAANNRIVNSYRAFKQTGFYQAGHRANPLDLIFRADNAQNNAFRKAVLYNKAKREAYQRMGTNARGIQRAQDRISHLLTLGPEEQIRSVLHDPKAFEAHARHLKDFLGDYVTYTAKERRIASRGIMFYGFLRFALRFTFWTMPVGHPTTSAILAQLGRLHNDELEELFGAEVPPWELTSYFTPDGETKIPLGRLNPFLNAAQYVDLNNAKLKPEAAVGFLPPFVQAALDQVAAKNLVFDKPYTVDNSGSYVMKGRDLTASQRGRILVSDLLGLSPIYRGLADASGKLTGKQTDTSSLPFPSPVEYKTPARAAENERDKAESVTGLEALKEELAPFLGQDATVTIRKARRYDEKNRPVPVRPRKQPVVSGSDLPELPDLPEVPELPELPDLP
jgi:hypothetical protein